MGKVEPKLKDQANYFTNLFKTNNFSESLAGDTHYFASYIEPKNNLHMSAVGAITATRNLQTSRYVMVEVYTDGSYNITDTETK